MTARPVAPDDFSAIAELSRRWEIANIGVQEQSEEEIREHFDRVYSLEADSLLVVHNDAILGVGARVGTDTMMFVDPDIGTAPVYDQLLDWFAEGTPKQVEALSNDTVLLARLAAKGWRHIYSAFELLRTVDDNLVLPEPVWPAGIDVRGYRDSDAEAVHHFIYVDAAWAEVPGHPSREYEEWRAIFLGAHLVPDQQVLAWRGQRLVGVAMGRTWDDGTGWVSQLASAKDERGRGLGRALLAASLRLRRDSGARALGLQVQAANRGALAMYLAAGLEIDREWMTFEP